MTSLKLYVHCEQAASHASADHLFSFLFGSQSSLDKAKSWVKELQRQANENIVIALAGNKLEIQIVA